MSDEQPPSASPSGTNSPNVRSQTGLSTPELIRIQAQMKQDHIAMPYLTAGQSKQPPRQPTPPANTHQYPPPFARTTDSSVIPTSTHEPIPTTNLPIQTNPPLVSSQPNPPTTSAQTSLPPSASSSTSSNPTIQPPAGYSPMTNTQQEYPHIKVPINHPMLNPYFYLSQPPETPSPDPCYDHNIRPAPHLTPNH
ncbi:hypothetical protein PCANC_16389 [Puccinia coronata f. sp. avenae]|uniref:Uncharacterized protein n=1 Tax=Puccinia coronata f. sp. avenae TaxID=200324 RepID=A0A2N5SYH4_9BASI|nr:hypothetical protein PCANC_16389 [Puccinia coronata f. sp. avenae]